MSCRKCGEACSCGRAVWAERHARMVAALIQARLEEKQEDDE